jgi:aldose 1-epimerase
MDHNEAPSGTQWTIRSGHHEAVVVEVGGGLRDYRYAGREVLDGYRADEVCPASAGSVLAPWPNRIRDGRYTVDGAVQQLALSEPGAGNAIHGLVRWAPWQAVKVSKTRVTVECTLPAQPGYPWALRLGTTWVVGADGLHVTHRATNLSARSAMFGLGVHPYLAVPGKVDDVLLTVPGRTRLLVDGRKLPIGAAKVAGGDRDFSEPRAIGEARLDDAYGDVPPGGSRVTLSTVDGQDIAAVWADDAFRWWQVFTGDALPVARARRSVAVEPMTCPPDAFHSGRDVVTIKPGQTWQGSWGITPGA